MNRIARVTTPRAGAATPSHVRVSEFDPRATSSPPSLPPHLELPADDGRRDGRLKGNLWRRSERVPKSDCGAAGPRFVLANVSHKGRLISLNLQGDKR